MHRKDYPNAAFGYVSTDETARLLLHHDPEQVKDGKEHDTVDPALLMLALELVDSIPIDEDSNRDALIRHLQMHANVILWTDPETAGLPIALHDKMRDFAFFKANLDGVSEVPPVTTTARGVAYILYNKLTREMSWFVNFLDLSSAETAAHFHIGKSGKLGPIEIPVALGNPKEGNSTLTKEQEKNLFEGNLFLNIHSSNWPVGEIRGQVIPAATSRSNNDESSEATHQVKPPKDEKPKADLKHIQPKDKGAVYNKVIRPPAETKPKGQIREDILTEPNRKSGDGGPEVSKPPKDEKPKSNEQENIQTEPDRKSGDGGPDVVKPPKEATMPKPEVRGNRVDFSAPLVNIIVDQAPITNETVKKIQESNTPTGVDGPPSVTVSKLSDECNADLKDLIDKAGLPKPGAGNIKLRDKVITFLTEKQFDGRLVIFPTTANEEDFQVLQLESAPKSRKSINNLPDAAFAVIERGGRKDDDGKTTPRDLRHLPHHTGAVKDPIENSTLDLPRLRNALARMNQVKSASSRDSTARIQRIAKAHLIRHARAKLPDSKFAESKQFKFKDMISEIDTHILEMIGNETLKVDAQLMEVKEESTVKLFRLKMGDKDSPITFFVRARFDENGDVLWIEFDFDTLLPAKAIPDFSKFLRSLPTA
jgi:hypothetical protein